MGQSSLPSRYHEAHGLANPPGRRAPPPRNSRSSRGPPRLEPLAPKGAIYHAGYRRLDPKSPVATAGIAFVRCLNAAGRVLSRTRGAAASDNLGRAATGACRSRFLGIRVYIPMVVLNVLEERGRFVIGLALTDPVRGLSSYLVGDESAIDTVAVGPGALGPAAPVLPADHVGLATRHVHADRRSAARESMDLLGLAVSLSHRAPASFPFERLHEGDVIVLGSLRVEVGETPRHTEDSLSLVVRDLSGGTEPWRVMTGESLFVGDVGRPDLAEGSPQPVRDAARPAYPTIRPSPTLPDFSEVYPAHYGASPCGSLVVKTASRSPQRDTNAASTGRSTSRTSIPSWATSFGFRSPRLPTPPARGPTISDGRRTIDIFDANQRVAK
jgi:hydroxyacylglutathione hydrolase